MIEEVAHRVGSIMGSIISQRISSHIAVLMAMHEKALRHPLDIDGCLADAVCCDVPPARVLALFNGAGLGYALTPKTHMRGFLKLYKAGVVIDNIQAAYIEVVVEEGVVRVYVHPERDLYILYEQSRRAAEKIAGYLYVSAKAVAEQIAEHLSLWIHVLLKSYDKCLRV